MIPMRASSRETWVVFLWWRLLNLWSRWICTSSVVYIVEGSSNARLHRLLMVKAPWLGALVDQGSKFLRSSDHPVSVWSCWGQACPDLLKHCSLYTSRWCCWTVTCRSFSHSRSQMSVWRTEKVHHSLFFLCVTDLRQLGEPGDMGLVLHLDSG